MLVMKKSGFTMIELIFVIVIIAILAVIALPKLAATRDDARFSMIAHNTMSSAYEIAAYATARGQTEPKFSDMSKSMENLVTKGYADDTGTYRADISSDDDTGVCLILRITNPGSNSETLHIEEGPATDDGCLRLKELIDFASYPIALRGNLISY